MRILVLSLLLLATVVSSTVAPIFVSHMSDMVSYNSCGQSMCSSAPAEPIDGYKCDCSNRGEHPDCGCSSSCDCAYGEAHPSCGCISSVPLPSTSATCVSCRDDDSAALPFSPRSSAPLPLPPIEEHLCLPNVAGMTPGNCHRGTDNQLCNDADSNCAAECGSGENHCYGDAVQSHCDCQEAAPAPCECGNSVYSNPNPNPVPNGVVNPCAIPNPCSVAGCCGQFPAPSSPQQQLPLQQGVAQIPAAGALPQQQQGAVQAENSTIPATKEEQEAAIKAYDEAKEAALKAEEAVRRESDNLKEQQEHLRKESEHLTELEERFHHEEHDFESKKEETTHEVTEEQTEEAKMDQQASQVVDIESRAKSLLVDIQHEAEQIASHVDQHTNPQVYSKIQIDRTQLDRLAQSIEALTKQTEKVNEEHVKLRERVQHDISAQHEIHHEVHTLHTHTVAARHV